MLKERILISFNETQSKQLRKESNRLGSSISSIVRMAVVQYFSGHGGAT